MTQAEAIRSRYARRRASPPDVCIHQERNRLLEEMLAAFSSNGKTARVWDVGCGNGLVLKHLLEIGFESQNLSGIDLLEGRIAAARRNLPADLRLRCGDATAPEFDWQTADIVLALTVFSSVLDSSYRRKLADRLWSAVNPGGGVLVYDFHRNNPLNKDVRRVTLGEIRTLFPQAEIHMRRLTLAPPLARIAERLNPKLYKPLSQITFLRTHTLYWLGKSVA